jgi:hypothetical protein
MLFKLPLRVNIIKNAVNQMTLAGMRGFNLESKMPEMISGKLKTFAM